MSIALQRTHAAPAMSREAFLDWVQMQDFRFEFDGEKPVAMVGGTVNHSRIGGNIYASLRERLRGTRCEVFNSDAGIATLENGVRFPDVVVTCSPAPGSGTLIPAPIIVFEVLSPSSGQIDRVIKLREYALVPSIRRYVILEYGDIGATVFERESASQSWMARALTDGDLVEMPEIDVAVPLSSFYENVDVGPAIIEESKSAGETAKPV